VVQLFAAREVDTVSTRPNINYHHEEHPTRVVAGTYFAATSLLCSDAELRRESER
jgi:hypothetical protein